MIARYHYGSRPMKMVKVIDRDKFMKMVREEWKYSHTDQKAKTYVFTRKSDGVEITVDVLMWQVAEELKLELLTTESRPEFTFPWTRNTQLPITEAQKD